jgi:acetyl esterase
MGSSSRALRAAVAIAAGALSLALLAACTSGGQPDDSATSRRDPALPRFTTDPDVPVVADLVYGTTDDGSRLLADVCLPPTGPDVADGQKKADAPGDGDGSDDGSSDAASGSGDSSADQDATAAPTPAPTSGDDGAAPPAGSPGSSATGDSTAQPDAGDSGTTGAASGDDVPEDATPAILMVHGGSWARGDKATIPYRATCQWLAKSTGFPVVNIDYRLAPAHPFPAGFDDVQTAVRWMRQPEQVQRFHIDPKRIGAFGGSAGANLVSLLGTTGSGPLTSGTRVAAVVELSGPVDLTGAHVDAKFVPVQESYLGCADLSCPAAEQASPTFQLSRGDPPFLVAHSVGDPIIQYAQSTAFVKDLRAKGIPTVFVKVDGGAHSIAMLSGNDRLRARIATFLTSRLAPGT